MPYTHIHTHTPGDGRLTHALHTHTHTRMHARTQANFLSTEGKAPSEVTTHPGADFGIHMFELLFNIPGISATYLLT